MVIPKFLEKYLDKSPKYLNLKDKVKFSHKSIVFITIDSLRYDVTMEANIPNFDKLFKDNKNRGWVKVGSHGTYTLPSHISMFHAGLMPCDNRKGVPAPFNREKEKLFKAQLAWERTTGAKYPTPAAPNIIKGFEKIGYRTIGIGGVQWFNDKFITSKIWGRDYFKEFYWKKSFSEDNIECFNNQIKLIKKLDIRNEKSPVFLFLNIANTHKPYMNFGRNVEGQKKALEEVDKELPNLLKVLPKEFDLIALSDHGDCFGEGGLWGHGFYHPKIMEIPFAYGEIKNNYVFKAEN